MPAAPHYSDGAKGDDLHRWFGVKVHGVYQPKDGPLVPYLKENGALRQCPSFHTSVGFDKGTGGYAYNDVAVGSRVKRMGFVPGAYDASMSQSEVKRPAETAMFADGALDIGTGMAEYAFLTPPPAVAARYFGQALDPSVHFRHNGRADVAFVDGHAAALSMEAGVNASPAYPKARPQEHGVGWFGPVSGPNPYDGE